MDFTAEFEVALRASTLAVAIAAWSFTRVAFGQPVLHPWLGAMTAGLISGVASLIIVVPGTGPIPEVVMNAAGITTGLLFSAGVRFEAIDASVDTKAFAVLATVALAIAVTLEIAVPDAPVRMASVQMLVGLTILGAVVWVPRLLRRTGPKLGAACLGLLAVGVAIDRAMPFLAAGGPQAFVFPYLERSDVIVIVAGTVAMIVFSVERARRERARRERVAAPPRAREV